MISGVEFDTHAKLCGDDFADLGQDLQNEASAFRGRAAVFISADIGLFVH